MAAPWEKYQTATADGPWAKYGAAAPSPYGIQGNPDASASEIDAMRRELIAKEQGGVIGNTLKEPLRFAGETANMIVNAPNKVWTDIKTLGTAAAGLLPGQDFDAKINEAAQMQKDYQPVQLFNTAPSQTGKLLNYAVEKGPKDFVRGTASLAGADAEQSNDLSNQLVDSLMNTAAVAGTAKGAPSMFKGVTSAPSVIKTTAQTMREASRARFEANKLNAVVDEGYAKAVRPSVVGKKNFTQSEQAIANQREAIKTIVDNKDLLGLETETGLPTNLQEFSQSVKKAKEQIYKDYNNLKNAAGETGVTIDLNPIASELESLAGNKVLTDARPQAIDYALKRADALRKRGTYTLDDMQTAIEIYNNDLQAFYKNPSPQFASQAAIDARVVSAMRQMLDDAITSEAGPGYSALKKQYGALKSIEPEVSSRAVVDARKNPSGLLDFTDIVTSGETLSGILVGNPMLVAKGIAGRGIKEWIKRKNNPNYQVDQMFKTVDKYHTKRAPVEIPETPAMYPQIPTTYDPSTGMRIPAVRLGGDNINTMGDYPAPVTGYTGGGINVLGDYPTPKRLSDTIVPLTPLKRGNQ